MSAVLTDRDAWLAERRRGIGGSDVAAVLGLDPYTTPYKLWREKTNQLDEEEKTSAAIRRGNVLEDCLGARYCLEVGPSAYERQVAHAAGLDGWRRGNQDMRARFSDGTKRAVEFKTVNRHVFRSDWGEPWSDEVPDRALCQGLWYGNLDDADLIDFAVLVMPDDPDEVLCRTAAEVVELADFHIYQVQRRPKLEEELVHRCEEFWMNHVVANVAPEPTAEDLELAFPKHIDGEVCVADPELMEKLRAYQAASDAAKAATDKKKALRDELMLRAGDAEAIVAADGRTPLWTTKASKRASYTVKETTTRSLRATKDWKALVKEVAK